MRGRAVTTRGPTKNSSAIDYRHINKLPTVITTAKWYDEIDERIYSRLQDTRLCTVCAIKASGYRGGSTSTTPRRQKRTKKV
jgi:hypothetical protein